MSRFSKQTAANDTGPALALVPELPPDPLLPLARAAVDGDPDAAATLVAHVASSILSVVRRVLRGGNADIDDVAQDATMAFLESLAAFRGECSVAHFAQRIAVLTALTALRRSRSRGRWSDASEQPIDDLADPDLLSPLATTLAGRRRDLVRGLLDELPPVIAEALALHFVLGYTVEEIASAASVSPNTVWSRLRLGKRALRRKLEGDARFAEMLDDPREGPR